MFFILFFLAVNATKIEEIEASIRSGAVTVIEYMIPTCHFCQIIEDDVNGLINDFKNVKGANVFQVDCTVESEFCDKTNTHSYPTVAVYKDNAYCTELTRPRELFPWKLRILEILHNPKTLRCLNIPADEFKQPSMPKFDPRFMPAGVKIEEIKEEPAKAKVEEVKAEEPVKVEEVKAEEPAKQE